MDSLIIQSTAGAVPYVNQKGNVSMQKVKVQRYITGKRPAYAPDSDQEPSDDDNDIFNEQDFEHYIAPEDTRLLNRLPEHRDIRQRREVEPQLIYEREDNIEQKADNSPHDSDNNDDDIDEMEHAWRRQQIRQRLIEEQNDRDALELEAPVDQLEEFSSEFEETSDSEEEAGPIRLKPIFVKKSDRITIKTPQDQENEDAKRVLEENKIKTERKEESLKLVEHLANLERQQEQGAETIEAVVNTDDENDEAEYEAWKQREIKRNKRDQEERERYETGRQEVERLHNLTDRERRIEYENNPKKVVNKQDKGEFKFLQKYYHRGAFYLTEEQDLFKRDFCQPTLEDHFDKAVLPKVMQVKNFGRSGRTKYTHLTDQDTSQIEESPWSQTNTASIKYQEKSGGIKQIFDRPSSKKAKTTYN